MCHQWHCSLQLHKGPSLHNESCGIEKHISSDVVNLDECRGASGHIVKCPKFPKEEAERRGFESCESTAFQEDEEIHQRILLSI